MSVDFVSMPKVVVRCLALGSMVVVTALSLTGCSGGGASFSDKEMAQIKEGPPKEMPKEAIEMMNRGKARGGPPPGQPGAGP